MNVLNVFRCLSLMAALSLSGQANAAPIIANFSGTTFSTGNAAFIPIGVSVSGTWSYDTAAVDSDSNPNLGLFFGYGGNLSFTLGGLGTWSSPSHLAQAFNDTPNPDDQIFVFGNTPTGPLLNGEVVTDIEVDFFGPTSMIPNDSLPSLTSLANATSFVVIFRTEETNFVSAFGFVDSISALPVPAAGFILMFGLIGFGVMRRQS